MHVTVNFGEKTFIAGLEKGIDLSLSMGPDGDNPNCYYINEARIEPFRSGTFVGSRKLGGSVNCEVVTFCAHGNGTHTEGLGHISQERVSMNKSINLHHFVSLLITVEPTSKNGDKIITRNQVEEIMRKWAPLIPPALIVRTLPNQDNKRKINYSGSNPPYFQLEALSYLRDLGVEHLLTDLPSVDKEQDEGKLLAHHAWWNMPINPRKNATITELIYVSNEVKDGWYLLNLQTSPFETDAVPSRPIIYPLNIS